MQARTRRNRVAILVSLTLCLTSTCEMQGDRVATQRSRAANIAYAATLGETAAAPDVQAGFGAINEGRSPSAGADAYEVADWWKADISEYDGSLTLISYEAAYTEPDEPLTMTTAVTTDTTLISDYTTESTILHNLSEDNEYNSVETTAAPLPAVVQTTVQEPVTTAPQTVQAIPGSVVFHSSGYGHGVGMSQNGANFYAKYDGWTYDQILDFYYPGTTLVRRSNVENETMTVSGKTDSVLSIVSQICFNEMGGYFSEEAIKAQAVAAYSFYLYNGKASGMVCKPNPPQRVIDAVRSVLGVAVYYNNAPALTMFYASSGGATADCGDIFYGKIPYLVSKPVQHDDTSDPNYNCTKVFSVSSLKSKLEKKYQVKLSGNPYDWIQLEYGDGGYVAYAVIGGQVRVKGNELRNVLGLKSPKYSFVYEDASSGND